MGRLRRLRATGGRGGRGRRVRVGAGQGRGRRGRGRGQLLPIQLGNRLLLLALAGRLEGGGGGWGEGPLPGSLEEAGGREGSDALLPPVRQDDDWAGAGVGRGSLPGGQGAGGGEGGSGGGLLPGGRGEGGGSLAGVQERGDEGGMREGGSALDLHLRLEEAWLDPSQPPPLVSQEGSRALPPGPLGRGRCGARDSGRGCRCRSRWCWSWRCRLDCRPPLLGAWSACPAHTIFSETVRSPSLSLSLEMFMMAVLQLLRSLR